MHRSAAARRGSLPLPLVALAGTLLTLLASLPAFASGTISRVAVSPDAQQLSISVFTAEDQPLQVKGFTLASPPRLVFDLTAGRLAPDVAETVSVPSSAVKQVRFGQFSPEVARIVVDVGAADQAGRPSGVTWQVKSRKGETVIVLNGAGSKPAVLELSEPTIQREADCVLVRFAGAGALERTIGVLDKPFRVYADLQGAESGWFESESDDAPLRAIRMGPQTRRAEHSGAAQDAGAPVARIVVELTQKQPYSIFTDGADLVIAAGPQPWALPLPKYAATGKLKGRAIVVDAGHGGNDIGAPAVFGSPPGEPYEKDVTLAIAHRLAQLLKSEGASVTMTRSDDTFIPLQQRAAVANKLKADAFISIHCNSCEQPDTLSGTSVYYDHPHSERFAELVQGELIASLGTSDKGVRNANFAVIRRTTGPGILVETAFINNKDDRAGLQNANFRERTARSIVHGLIKYLKETSRKQEASG